MRATVVGKAPPDLHTPGIEPPEPARVPEPWPPPDEADRPSPERPPDELPPPEPEPSKGSRIGGPGRGGGI